MNWLHCNACGYQPSSEDSSGDATMRRAVFVTNCGHVFCQKCVVSMRGRPGSNETGKCVVCQNAAVRLVQIGPRLKPEVRAMFDDCCKTVKSVYSTIDFQTRQAAHLIQVQEKRLQELTQQLKNAQEESQQMGQRLKSVGDERDKLRSENMAHKKEIESLKNTIAALKRSQEEANRATWSHQQERRVIEGGGYNQTKDASMMHRTSTPIGSRSAGNRGWQPPQRSFFNGSERNEEDFLKTPAAFKSKGVFSQYPNSQMDGDPIQGSGNAFLNRSRGNQSLDRTFDKATRNLNFQTTTTSATGSAGQKRPFRQPQGLPFAKRRIQPPPAPVRKRPAMDQTEIFPF